MPVLLYLLAIAVFAQGTSEFVLAGLLPGIAADLGVSVGRAGLLTSAFALGMVAGAPLMAALGRRLPPRWTLSGFLALFIAVHVLGALTDDFGVLLATRIVAALANAGFLAVALSTVVGLVAEPQRARALSVILGGTTLALIAGVPAGAFVGSVLGWRATLWAIAALSVPALLAVVAATPTRAGDKGPLGSVRAELATLRDRSMPWTLGAAVLVNAATFCSFTYLAAIATGPPGFAERVVPALLCVFGVGAFLGVTAAGRHADRHWRRVVTVTGPLLVLGWVSLAVLVADPWAWWILVLLQGALSFAMGATLIARIMAVAHRAPTMNGSFATVALNIGAVLGPVAGGVAYQAYGARGPLVASAVLALLAIGSPLSRRPRPTVRGPRS